MIMHIEHALATWAERAHSKGFAKFEGAFSLREASGVRPLRVAIASAAADLFHRLRVLCTANFPNAWGKPKATRSVRTPKAAPNSTPPLASARRLQYARCAHLRPPPAAIH